VKVAVVVPSLSTGGAEKVAVELCNYLVTQSYSVFLISLRQSDPAFWNIHPSVARVQLDLTSQSAGILEAVRANLHRVCSLRAAFLSLAPGVVISFGHRTNILTIVSTLGLALPVIAAERSNPRLDDPSRFWRGFRPLAYKRAHAIVVQTGGAAECFARIGRPVTVIPNPVFPSRLRTSTAGLSRIAAVGRLSPEKGFDVLLRAFARVARRHACWQLHIWGVGPERGSLELLARELCPSGAVVFRDLSDEPQSWTAEAELFVLSSRFEGFPNALAEAMASGMAVIATDCQFGPRELISSGVNGILVPVDGEEEMARVLDLLMTDKEMRSRLGAAAPAVADRFASDKVFRCWDGLIRSLQTR
jgi:glycosyltransferase involved in cell wall biosynthesis